MQPDKTSLKQARRIAGKEITLFFSSPIAYLFLAAFVGVTLFIFFWGESFFARNIADVRPLFEWMPLLLVFLASALTMRMWSEERRAGTLEHVLTQSAPLWCFVLGKFLACLVLLCAALLITLPLPITVALIAELDWGPVGAGYLAAVLLGAAYLSIGLFVSARSDNQIVSLICAVALCGFFYLLGTGVLTSLVGNQTGQWLRLLGTGSRFESITRGVIDFRDLYYYLSLIAVFLVLNVYVLERERWSAKGAGQSHRCWQAVAALLIANALGANLWLGQVAALRLDLTAGRQYSLSEASKTYLAQLREPLLLRGYFSSRTHPLLAPLAPQLQDLMQEYEIAAQGQARVEIVDPLNNPDLEQEANQKFGIEPVPFQVADRYQSSIVSSYFHVLVQYGDEFQVLGFQDLIEIKGQAGSAELDVQLRNPEHDLTRAIRTVLNDYQAGGNLFATVPGELTFAAYISADELLPDYLREFRTTVQEVVQRAAADSEGRLAISFLDPEAGDAALARQIAEDYGFAPMRSSLLSLDSFYFYLTLANAEQVVQIPLDDMTEGSLERNLNAGIKRFAAGFTRTIGLVAPAADPMTMQFGVGGRQFNELRAFLSAELNVQDEDLGDGRVDGDIDLLLLLAPENLGVRELFAIDQFLMQGGTVIAATSPYKSNFAGDSLSVQPVDSGLEEWLAHHGLSIGRQLVMDTRNAAFPVPVTRDLGGFRIQEWRLLDYPYFIDLRGAGLDEDLPLTADLPQLTLAWSSPLLVDEEKNAARTVQTMFRSSPESWLSSSIDVMPAIDASGSSSYSPEGDQQSHVLGLISSGRFDSYFAGEDSPLLEEESADEGAGQGAEDALATGSEGDSAIDLDEALTDEAEDEEVQEIAAGVIERSPESARLILIGSNDFLDDAVIQLLGTAAGGDYQNSLQLMANSIDWSLEDAGLLSIRSRGNFNRTLPPLAQSQQVFWEYLNYSLAGLALAAVALIHSRRRRGRERHYSQFMAS